MTGKSELAFTDLLWELSRVLRACQQENICGEGITFQQLRILDSIALGRAAKMSDLSDVLSVDKSTVTRLLEPLLKKGLVEKGRQQSDSRICCLNLSAEGLAVYQRARDCLQEFGQRVEKEIPEEEKEQVLEAITSFLRALDRACSGYKCC